MEDDGISPDTDTFNRGRKPLPLQSREIVYNVYKFFRKEAEKYRYHLTERQYFLKVHERTALATKVSQRTLLRILREFENDSESSNSQPEPETDQECHIKIAAVHYNGPNNVYTTVKMEPKDTDEPGNKLMKIEHEHSNESNNKSGSDVDDEMTFEIPVVAKCSLDNIIPVVVKPGSNSVIPEIAKASLDNITPVILKPDRVSVLPAMKPGIKNRIPVVAKPVSDSGPPALVKCASNTVTPVVITRITKRLSPVVIKRVTRRAIPLVGKTEVDSVTPVIMKSDICVDPVMVKREPDVDMDGSEQ